jgi:glycogenin glucosyltransferase
VYPIVVLVTPQVSEATKIRLQSICNQTITVEPIICPYKNTEHEASWTNSELTKLHVWNLLQFEKVVYLDADTLVIENIDELFEIQSSFAASPDIFPPDKFNAGVLVIQPNASVFHEMISLVGVLSSHDGGDTGFLNSYFSNWYVFIPHLDLIMSLRSDARDSIVRFFIILRYTSSPESRLSFGYNAQRTLFWFTHAKQPGYWELIKPLKVIHYSSSPKPCKGSSLKFTIIYNR